MPVSLGASIPFTRVDQKYYKVLLIISLIWAAVFTLPCFVLGFLYGLNGFPGALWWIASVFSFVLSAWALFLVRRRVQAIGYFESEHELVVHSGILFEKLTVIPYGRTQQVNISSGPLMRYFDLASIRLVTASAATEAEVKGISRSEAERLRKKLTDLGVSQSEGL